MPCSNKRVKKHVLFIGKVIHVEVYALQVNKMVK